MYFSLQENGDQVAPIGVNFDREIFISQRYGGISHSFSKLIEQFFGDKELGILPKFSFSKSDNEHLREVLKSANLELDPQRKFLVAKI
jgi:hypothetical protein